ncbi:phage holin family protein [Paenibacillus sp. FSL L8-0435]|uniref:phage holin family protein n=1 Tax=Paenibacillus sp. FSL L8-0435 TaxID=2954618 RepID=UPI0030DB05BB
MSDKFLNFIVGVVGSVTSYMFGGWSNLLELLAILTILDFITGIVASAIEGHRYPDRKDKGLNSNKGSLGIAKKALMFTVIFVMYKIDTVLGLNGTLSLAVGATYFYIANELLSLTENWARSGLPIPSQVKKAISILKDKSGEVSDSKDNKNK